MAVSIHSSPENLDCFSHEILLLHVHMNTCYKFAMSRGRSNQDARERSIKISRMEEVEGWLNDGPLFE
jgi:hypothetical protein